MLHKLKELILGKKEVATEVSNYSTKNTEFPRSIEKNSRIYSQLNQALNNRMEEVFSKDWGELDKRGSGLSQNGRVWMNSIYDHFAHTEIYKLNNENFRQVVLERMFLALFLRIQRIAKILIEEFESLPNNDYLVNDDEFEAYFQNEEYIEFPILQNLKKDYTNHLMELSEDFSCNLTEEEASRVINYLVETVSRITFVNYRILRRR